MARRTILASALAALALGAARHVGVRPRRQPELRVARRRRDAEHPRLQRRRAQRRRPPRGRQPQLADDHDRRLQQGAVRADGVRRHGLGEPPLAGVLPQRRPRRRPRRSRTPPTRRPRRSGRSSRATGATSSTTTGCTGWARRTRRRSRTSRCARRSSTGRSRCTPAATDGAITGTLFWRGSSGGPPAGAFVALALFAAAPRSRPSWSCGGGGASGGARRRRASRRRRPGDVRRARSRAP